MMPDGLLIGSMKVQPAEPGVLEMVIAGRSQRMDAAATLDGLKTLVESLNKIDVVRKASSTTLEEEGDQKDGVPFNITLQLAFADARPLEPEGTQ